MFNLYARHFNFNARVSPMGSQLLQSVPETLGK